MQPGRTASMFPCSLIQLSGCSSPLKPLHSSLHHPLFHPLLNFPQLTLFFFLVFFPAHSLSSITFFTLLLIPLLPLCVFSLLLPTFLPSMPSFCLQALSWSMHASSISPIPAKHCSRPFLSLSSSSPPLYSNSPLCFNRKLYGFSVLTLLRLLFLSAQHQTSSLPIVHFALSSFIYSLILINPSLLLVQFLSLSHIWVHVYTNDFLAPLLCPQPCHIMYSSILRCSEL